MTVSVVTAPEQSQLIKLDLEPTLGHEQKGYRPALAVSGTIFNQRTGFCWVVPVTSRQKGLPNEIRLPDHLPVHGNLLLSQLRSIDWRARSFTTSGVVPAEFFDDIAARLSAVLEPE